MPKKLSLEIVVDDKGSIKIKNFGKTMSKTMKDSEKGTDKLTKTVSKGLNIALIGATAAAAAFGTAIFKATQIGMQFDKTMKMVGAVSGANAEQFQQLKDAAKEMGETTEFSASQSAEALKFLAMAGLGVKDSIQALPGMLDLATASQMDLGLAADIVTDTLTAFGMKTSELTRLSDAFIATSTKTNTTVQKLGESFRYVAPIAAQLGFDVEQTAGFLGVMANAGIKASDAGTDLRQVMLKTAKAAEKLGLGAGASLNEVLKEMHDRQLSANEVTELFGMLASKSALVLMNNVDAIKKYTKEIKAAGGITDEIAKKMRDGLNQDLAELRSILEGTGISMFEVFSPSLRETVQEITKAVKDNKDMFLLLADAASAAFKVMTMTTKVLNAMTPTFFSPTVAPGAKEASQSKMLKALGTSREQVEMNRVMPSDFVSDFSGLAPTPDFASDFGGLPPSEDIKKEAGVSKKKAVEDDTALINAMFLQLEGEKYAESLEAEREYRELMKEIGLEYSMLDAENEIAILERKNKFFSDQKDLAIALTKIEAVELRNREKQEIEAEKQNIKNAQMGSAYAVSIAKNMYTLLGSESSKAFKLMQATQIAETIINTYASATAAYKAMAGIPIYGPALGAAAAAAAIVSGLANVKAISSQTMHDGGIVGQEGFTKGLKSDERARVLQTGERVLSREEYADVGGEEGLSGGGITVGSLVTINGSLIADEGTFNGFVDEINDRLLKIKEWGY